MARERLIGSYLIRFTEHGRRTSTHVHDLRSGATLEFETWVSAWEYLDTVLRNAGSDSSSTKQPVDGPGAR